MYCGDGSVRCVLYMYCGDGSVRCVLYMYCGDGRMLACTRVGSSLKVHSTTISHEIRKRIQL